MSDKLLTAEEVAEVIGMTPAYVYGLSRRGGIPTITFGRQRRYRRESIDTWLSEIEANGSTRREKRTVGTTVTNDSRGGAAL